MIGCKIWICVYKNTFLLTVCAFEQQGVVRLTLVEKEQKWFDPHLLMNNCVKWVLLCDNPITTFRDGKMPTTSWTKRRDNSREPASVDVEDKKGWEMFDPILHS